MFEILLALLGLIAWGLTLMSAYHYGRASVWRQVWNGEEKRK